MAGAGLFPACELGEHLARRYPWGKLGEGYTGSVCVISYNCL